MKKTVMTVVLAAILLGATACESVNGLLNFFSSDEEAHSSSPLEESSSANGDNGNVDEEWFDPWDNLEGGGTAEDGEVSDEKADDYLQPDDADKEEDWQESDVEGAVNIHFSTLTADNAPEGTEFEDGTLTIKADGVYALNGTFTGNVVVKDSDGAIQVMLNNATIVTPEDSASAAILFEKTGKDRVLTAVSGTVNTVSDSVGDTDADGDGAAIQAKKCSLVVNGGGKLILNGVGEEAAGLKVKKELTIVDTQLEINAVKNGIKADQKISVYNANIKIVAGGDGMKTDMEAGTAEEAAEFAADPNAGYIYIENTSFDITAGDDGISANNCLYIANTEANTVKIMTNNGAPNTVTEASSDNADGKALKADGITLVEGDTETDIPAGYEENYALVITGGKFEINSNDDAITSKGNLIISGGEFTIATGDDALHAEYLTKITDGDITITKSYEGVEGAAVDIRGGTLDITSADDGINAANKDLSNYEYYIYISGGDITVNAQGDGIDSNGWVKIEGGKVIVHGPTNGGNGSLDADRGILMNGGDLCAVGAAGMVENPGANSAQCYISLNLSSTQSAGTVIAVYDENGTALFTLTPKKTYQSVIISLSSFAQGKTYTVQVGDSAYEATLTNIGTALGTNQGGWGNQGFVPGGPGGFPGGFPGGGFGGR